MLQKKKTVFFTKVRTAQIENGILELEYKPFWVRFLNLVYATPGLEGGESNLQPMKSDSVDRREHQDPRDFGWGTSMS